MAKAVPVSERLAETDTGTRPRIRWCGTKRGNDGGTYGREVLELAKPSWPRGESPRRKVGVGNSAEGQRVAAGSVGVRNLW